jgi:peptide/nickel transport system permease protein
MLAPYILLGPALFIVLTVLALNLIGEGLRDMLDPFETPAI